MPEERAFVFTCNGQPFGPPARDLKEFVRLQARLPIAALEGHAQRGAFSRWIRNVFGDEPLAVEIRQVEKDFRQGRTQLMLRDQLFSDEKLHSVLELERVTRESFPFLDVELIRHNSRQTVSTASIR